MDCHTTSREGADIVLCGNPNCGKSSVFNHLTGMNINVSNYPGTTMDVIEGKSSIGRVADLPGMYSLGCGSDDERDAKNYILNENPRVIINIIDSNLLERNLFLTLQLIELKISMVIALNFHEEAAKIDSEKLSEILGVPVVRINALTGKGIPELKKACKVAKIGKKIRYSTQMEQQIRIVSSLLKKKKRALAILALEKDKDIWAKLTEKEKNEIKKKTRINKTEIAVERYRLAKKIVDSVSEPTKVKEEGRLSKWTIEPIKGTLIMLLVLGTMFAALFFLGGVIGKGIDYLFSTYIAPPAYSLIGHIGNNFIETILKFAFVDGINAGLQIAVPYILIFYVVIAILEDVGYLPRMCILLDRVTHKMGIHGKYVIPMMLGFGCTVPAIMSTKMLPNRRERVLTATMVSMIPCSARTAVILGSVGHFIGWQYALAIYGIVLVIIFLTGFILNKHLPGKSGSLI